MTARVSVLGGGGFVGRAVVARLLELGWRVTVLTRAREPAAPVRAVIGDARDALVLRRAVERSDAVVNLLGQITRPILHCLDLNSSVAARLAEMLARSDVPVVHVSSVAVYGAARRADERTDPEPTTPYGTAKLVAERLLAARLGALTLLRVSNVFGPHQAQGLVAYLVRARRGGRPLHFEHDGSMRRDFVHVADVADAVALALARPSTSVRTLNIGSGRQHSVRQLIALCQREWGVRFRVRYGTKPVLDNIQSIPVTRARRALRFQARRRLLSYVRDAAQ